MKKLPLIFLLFILPSLSLADDEVPAIPKGVQYHVGDPIRIEMAFKGKGYSLAPPDEEALKPFEVSSREELYDEEEGVTRIILEGSIFKTGDFEIPPLTILDGEGRMQFTSPVKISITSLLKEDEKEIRGPKPQLALTERGPIWPWLVLLLLVAVAVILYLWLKKKKRAEASPEVVAPEIPPHVEALATLEGIKSMSLLRRGGVKEFYTLVSDVVRVYKGKIHGIDAMEKTTGEVMEFFGRRSVEGLDELKRFLEEADRVKFAKYAPPEMDINGLMSRAEALVRRDIPTGGMTEAEADAI